MQTLCRVSHDKNNPYVMLNRDFLRDKSISFRARGFLAYVLTFKEDWHFSVIHIARQNGMGKDAVYSIINELIEFGYCMRTVIKNDKAQYESCEYVFYENSHGIQKKIPRLDFPDMEVPGMENTDTKNKQEERNTKKKDIPTASDATTDVDRSNNFFLQEKLKIKPDFTSKISRSWSNSFARLLKLRKVEEIEKIIFWALADPFWSTVITAPSGIEKNLDKIESQMRAKVAKVNPEKEKYQRFEENKKYAGSLKKQFGKLFQQGRLRLDENCIWLDKTPLGFAEHGFKEQIENELRKIGDKDELRN